MARFQTLHSEGSHFSKIVRSGIPGTVSLLRDVRGAALLEFAISLPLLVVFVVGIYDFSAAFNEKQKIAQAAQEGAIIAGAQPMTDIAPSAPSTPTNPNSLLPVVTAIFNSLAAGGMLPNANLGTCAPPGVVSGPVGLAWTYTISGCSGAGDNLVIIVNRGWVSGSGPPVAVGTTVTVTYPYHWRFNSVIQLLIPGASYLATTTVTENATVSNQM